MDMRENGYNFVVTSWLGALCFINGTTEFEVINLSCFLFYARAVFS